MKRRFCIITLITAFYSCSGSGNNETTTPESVTLNGVTWATRNIASSGTFAEVPESFGGYFTFDEAQSVCPSGWRLPVKPELDVLAGVESKWVALNGVFGREFGSGENTLFIPAAGYRYGWNNQNYWVFGRI